VDSGAEGGEGEAEQSKHARGETAASSPSLVKG